MRKYSSLLFSIYIGSFLLLLLGLVVIFGWLTGSVNLIQINPQFVPMQFNTALGFVLISIAIIGVADKLNKLTRYISIVLILLGGSTLIQQIFGINLFIDELFIKHYITVATSQAGRMAPNTALNFVLSGITLYTLSQNKIHLNHLLVGSLLGAVTMGLGTVAFLGYLSNVETAYGWGQLTRMAIHTSFGFMVVGLLLILETRELSRRFHQKIPTLVLPLTLNLVGMTITVCLWQALYSSEMNITNRYGIQTTTLVISGVLIFGCIFSVVIAIATWFAMRSHEQLQALRSAQSEILLLNQQLEKLSYLDGLTEIANRRAFDIAIQKELSRAYRYQYSISLILLDIDYFKAYNDYYGHQLGDECIKKIAHALNVLAKRTTDMAARYGGEEFVLLLPEAKAEDVEKIVEKTLNAIADLRIPHAVSPINSFVTISAGIVALIPDADTTPEVLIEQADQALYQAKANGRNCFVAVRNQ
ncbi:GGDEF domain-containing protein [Pseudanabaena mucicola]|uniref:GGDEF domain-containing protein n=1 Tax=Pseudanabaena mucicola FACHB-723 TaxID=2692860 RepID=A0ABR7ZY96_9CYAN|nr:diguanylate cyclase [Pseudanabaena mucicola]MBD2188981.1 GGDEF domain-containing protein [Pseudanabaena mucicola FACHB-723]